MEKLKQNNLSESTSELGFVKVINANAEELGVNAKVALQREVELEDGSKVIVEGITPDTMKSILNKQIEADVVSFATPGEIVETSEGTIDGVVQLYNNSQDTAVVSSLSEETEPETIEDESDLESEDLTDEEIDTLLNDLGDELLNSDENENV